MRRRRQTLPVLQTGLFFSGGGASKIGNEGLTSSSSPVTILNRTNEARIVRALGKAEIAGGCTQIAALLFSAHPAPKIRFLGQPLGQNGLLGQVYTIPTAVNDQETKGYRPPHCASHA